MKISCSELYAHAGRYLDIAQAEPVIITSFGHDRAVLISAEVFSALRARASADAQKLLEGGVTVPIRVFRKTFAHGKERALNKPVFVVRKSGPKAVLLSRKTFDALFRGDVAKRPAADTLQKITVSEFHDNVCHYLHVSRRRPLLITKQNREKNALLSTLAFRILTRSKSAKAISREASLAVSVGAFTRRVGYYHKLSMTRPVIITVNEYPRNVLMPAKAFRRLFTNDRSTLITYVDSKPPVYPAELRDKYTYENVLQRAAIRETAQDTPSVVSPD